MRNAFRITMAASGAVLAAAGGFAYGSDVAAGQSVPLPRSERSVSAAGGAAGTVAGGAAGTVVGGAAGTVVGPYIGTIGGAMAGTGAGSSGTNGAAAITRPPSPPSPSPSSRGTPPVSLRDPVGESRLSDDHRP